MFDHIAILVKDIEASRAFYTTLLATLGYKVLMTIDNSSGVHGYGKFMPQFWLAPINEDKQGPPSQRVHIAFSAKNRAQVDAFYETGLKAGGKSNGAPGVRKEYHRFYYGCFLYDLDGNNIECVCHWPLTLLYLTSWPAIVGGAGKIVFEYWN